MPGTARFHDWCTRHGAMKGRALGKVDYDGGQEIHGLLRDRVVAMPYVFACARALRR